MIKIDTSQVLAAIKDIGNLNERYAIVQRHTISDLKSRVPGKVSKAVSEVYAIPKSYVIAMRHPNTKGRVRMRVAGKTISTLSFIFRGSKSASDWTVKANKSRKAKTPTKRKIIFKNGRKFSVPAPYKVTVETFRGNPVQITGRGGNRVFVAPGKQGRLMAMIVSKDNPPVAHGVSSLPQAIQNKKVVAIWQPQLNKIILDRFQRNAKRQGLT